MPDDAARRHVAAHLRTLGREMGAMSRTVSRSLGLHPTQLQAIEAVLQQPRMSAGELSRVLGLSTGATTSLLDHLVQLGHLQRRADPADRRRVVVEITEQARRELEGVLGELDVRLEEMTRGYTSADLAVADHFLEQLTHTIEHYAAELPCSPSPERP